MPRYAQFAKNAAGEYVGFDADSNQWVPVHPKDVPGTIAQRASLKPTANKLDPHSTGDPKAKTGFLESMISRALGGTGTENGPRQTIGESFRGNVRGATGIPTTPEEGESFLDFWTTPQGKFGALTPLVEGVMGSRQAAAERITSGQSGENTVTDAVELAVPVLGTIVGGISRQMQSPDPYERSQASGAILSIAAPAAVRGAANLSPRIGRALKESGKRSLAKAGGANDRIHGVGGAAVMDDMTQPSGRHNTSPTDELLEHGSVVSTTRGNLVQNIKKQKAERGARIAQQEAQYPPGSLNVDTGRAVQKIMDEVDKVADASGRTQPYTLAQKTKKLDPKTGKPILKNGQPVWENRTIEIPAGKTDLDSKYIQNLYREAENTAPNVDLQDALHVRRQMGDQVSAAEGFSSRAGEGDIPVQRRARATREAYGPLADEIDAVTPEIVPNRRFVAEANKFVEMAEKQLGADWATVAGIPKTVLRNAIYRVIGYGASSALGGFGTAAAIIDAAQAMAGSTLRRTVAARLKYNLGKFLEGPGQQQLQSLWSAAGGGAQAGKTRATSTSNTGGPQGPAGGAGGVRGAGGGPAGAATTAEVVPTSAEVVPTRPGGPGAGGRNSVWMDSEIVEPPVPEVQGAWQPLLPTRGVETAIEPHSVRFAPPTSSVVRGPDGMPQIIASVADVVPDRDAVARGRALPPPDNKRLLPASSLDPESPEYQAALAEQQREVLGKQAPGGRASSAVSTSESSTLPANIAQPNAVIPTRGDVTAAPVSPTPTPAPAPAPAASKGSVSTGTTRIDTSYNADPAVHVGKEGAAILAGMDDAELLAHHKRVTIERKRARDAGNVSQETKLDKQYAAAEAEMVRRGKDPQKQVRDGVVPTRNTPATDVLPMRQSAGKSKPLSRELQDEVDDLVEYEREAALEDGEDFKLDDKTMERVLGDIEDRDDVSPKIKKEIREWMISKGVYREISDAELERTFSSKGKKYDFQMNGKKYVFDKHLDDKAADVVPTRSTADAVSEGDIVQLKDGSILTVAKVVDEGDSGRRLMVKRGSSEESVYENNVELVRKQGESPSVFRNKQKKADDVLPTREPSRGATVSTSKGDAEIVHTVKKDDGTAVHFGRTADGQKTFTMEKAKETDVVPARPSASVDLDPGDKVLYNGEQAVIERMSQSGVDGPWFADIKVNGKVIRGVKASTLTSRKK